MSGLSRKLALSNLYNRNYDITHYITNLINKSKGEGFRRNGFVKTSNPHKEVIIYEIPKAEKFVFKEMKNKKYELIVHPIQQLI